MTQGTGLISDRKLLLTADKSRVVEADDPDGAFLLANVGTLISGEDVARLGLSGDGNKITQKKPAAALPVEGERERGAIEAAVKDRLKADYEMRIDAEVNKELEAVKADMEDVDVPKATTQRAGKDDAARRAEAEQRAAQQALAQNRAPLISRQAMIDRGDTPVTGGPNAPKVEDEDKKGEKARQEVAKEAGGAKKSGR